MFCTVITLVQPNITHSHSWLHQLWSATPSANLSITAMMTYSRPRSLTSIQNSPDWPSVKSLSPYPSIRTLNGPDDGEDSSEDILSLANFSFADSDRSSVLTVRLTSPINSRSSTPRAREHMHSNSLKQGEL